MARKKEKKEDEVDTGAWLDTYGDMITLLLTFFVLLLASSSQDSAKLKAIASYFNPSISFLNSGETVGEGIAVGNGMSQLPDYQDALSEAIDQNERETIEQNKKMESDFKTYFQKNNISSKVEVTSEEDYVKVTFKDSVLFDKSKADLKPDAKEVLDIVSEQLIKYPNTDITIEGHADSDQINTIQFPSNWELSAARAISVARYFINEKGFSPERMVPIGRGEYQPVASNETVDGKAQNRRVEIKIRQRDSSNN